MPLHAYFKADNLELLRQLPSDCIDLVYADPPFNKQKTFSASQASGLHEVSFADHWGKPASPSANFQPITGLCDKLNTYLESVHALGEAGLQAYLYYMTLRLIELYRVLKKTGTLYWHCDTSSSHYIKIVLDSIFGIPAFRNEIVWAYKWGGVTTRDFPRKHDIIFRYTKGKTWTFNDSVVREAYISQDKRWHNHPQGKLVRDIWDDIPIINTQAKERTGYPTQKPLALLQRILGVSSQTGDLILDPFGGSGTTWVAAQGMERKSISIDSNPKAYAIAAGRLPHQELPCYAQLPQPFNLLSAD